MSLAQRQHKTRAGEQGFTMVVIAALFVAFAVIAAAAIERNTTIQQITRRDQATAQLSRLANAIIEYSVFNKNGTTNLYPCPAQLGVVFDAGAGTADFGAAVTDCSLTANDGNPTAGYTGGATTEAKIQILGTDVVRGMVPVLELSQYGINSNDAFDPWNNRIMYIVNRTQTKSTSPPTSTQTNNPTLVDKRTGFAYTGTTLVRPDFILISYGRDGLGGQKNIASVSGNTATLACPGGSSLLSENCNSDTTFWIAPTYTHPKASDIQYFDDILTWYRQ